MSTLKVQRDVNQMNHEATCRTLVELVGQEVTNVKRFKGDLREAEAMMKAVTHSHVAYIQSVQGDSVTSDKSSQWMQAIKDRQNTAKNQAEDKLETLGALDQVDGPPSKAVVKTQLKRSERTLRGTNSVLVTNMDRLASQQMTQAQYQVREEYRAIMTTKEFLTPMLSEVSLSCTKLVENMPQPEQATGPGGAGGPAEDQEGPAAGAACAPPERKPLRLGP